VTSTLSAARISKQAMLAPLGLEHVTSREPVNVLVVEKAN